MKTEALAYMRCSGNGQIDGDTWDRQETAIRRFAESAGIEIIQWFRDEGVSGKMELENRSGLAACLERIESNGVRMVIVESADRLARDSMVSELIVRQFQKVGATVISAAGGVDLTIGDDSNPTAKLIRQVLAAIAEFDRNVTVLKLRAARQRAKSKKGRCEGRKPFGDRDGEQRVVEIIRAWKDGGRTAVEIASGLSHNGLKTRYDRDWTPTQVRRVLARTAA